MSDTATYKSRSYRLLWKGKTKYGERAKLGFFNGEKEFWVPASEVTIVASVPTSNGLGCAECGRGGHLVRDEEDGLLKHYNCCDMPSDEDY